MFSTVKILWLSVLAALVSCKNPILNSYLCVFLDALCCGLMPDFVGFDFIVSTGAILARATIVSG